MGLGRYEPDSAANNKQAEVERREHSKRQQLYALRGSCGCESIGGGHTVSSIVCRDRKLRMCALPTEMIRRSHFPSIGRQIIDSRSCYT